MTTHAPSTCTVHFAHGACGKPSVVSNGTFAECAEHADGSPFSITTWGSKRAPSDFAPGDIVIVNTASMERRVRVIEVRRTRATVEFVVGRKGHERTVTREVAIAACRRAV
jgi:hypothetical protein